MMKTIFLTVNTKQEDNISDDEDNIFYGEDKTRGKETLRNVVGERKLRRVFPATLYDGDDDGGDDSDGGGDGGGGDDSDCDGNHDGDNDGSNLIIIAHGETDVVRHNRHKVNHRHHRPENIKDDDL